MVLHEEESTCIMIYVHNMLSLCVMYTVVALYLQYTLCDFVIPTYCSCFVPTVYHLLFCDTYLPIVVALYLQYTICYFVIPTYCSCFVPTVYHLLFCDTYLPIVVALYLQYTICYFVIPTYCSCCVPTVYHFCIWYCIVITLV